MPAGKCNHAAKEPSQRAGQDPQCRSLIVTGARGEGRFGARGLFGWVSVKG